MKILRDDCAQSRKLDLMTILKKKRNSIFIPNHEFFFEIFFPGIILQDCGMLLKDAV